MEHYARSEKVVLVFLLIINLLLYITKYLQDGYVIDIYFSFCIIYSILILIALFIQYKVKIEKHSITYEVAVFQFPIYRRVVFPQEIKRLKFKRVGWAKKGSVIQTIAGLNVRIVNFNTDYVLKELEDFANEHGISTEKTKDYLILETK
nr:hypothetical protein [Lysinibacillus timonensis]